MKAEKSPAIERPRKREKELTGRRKPAEQLYSVGA
jgi:hypothetical protein